MSAFPEPGSPAPTTAGALAPMARLPASLISRKHMTSSWTGRSGVSSRCPRWPTTRGGIWATWDPKAPAFQGYLGDMKLHLDNLLDCRDGREGGSEVLGGIQKWVMPCNWKFLSESFAGDSYHNISHRSVDLARIGPSGRARRDNDQHGGSQRLLISFPGTGHAATGVRQSEDSPNTTFFGDDRIVNEYFAHATRNGRSAWATRPASWGLLRTSSPTCRS